MTATRWDYSNLLKLSQERGLPDPTEHLVALSWKWARADFHAEMATSVWDDLLKQPFRFGHPSFGESVFAHEAHVEACICCLHALSDLMAQVVNDLVLKGELTERAVTMRLVRKRLSSLNVADGLRECIGGLCTSKEFQYVAAFCNTLKHRCRVKSTFRAEYGDESRDEEGIVFRQFTYDGNEDPQPEMWSKDILDNHKPAIGGLAVKVGVALEDYVTSI